MQPSRSLAATVIGLLAASVSLLATPASAADFTASGTIQRSASNGVSATDIQFRHATCPEAPSTQGMDAYVFTVPPAYAVAGTTVTLTAPSTAVHDLGAYIYNSDCSFDRNMSDPGSTDLTVTLAEGDTFLVVYTASGANVTVSLTATLASPPPFTASATIERSAPNGVSVTDTEFRTTCPDAPSTQGLDAFAFTLPAAYAVMWTTVSLTAPSTTVHDLGAYVYNSDCSLDRQVVTAATFDLTMTLGDDDTYLVVYSTSGANVPVSLTATVSANTGYISPGAILRSSPTGIPATDTEFTLTCPDAPASQGADAWVFTVPSGYGTSATLTTYPSTATHDFTAYIYNSDCSFDRTVDSATSTDLAFALEADDGWVSVYSATGANIWVEFKVS